MVTNLAISFTRIEKFKSTLAKTQEIIVPYKNYPERKPTTSRRYLRVRKLIFAKTTTLLGLELAKENLHLAFTLKQPLKRVQMLQRTKSFTGQEIQIVVSQQEHPIRKAESGKYITVFSLSCKAVVLYGCRRSQKFRCCAFSSLFVGLFTYKRDQKAFCCK